MSAEIRIPVPKWHRKARCLNTPEPDMFFPVGNNPNVAAAVKICSECPVRGKCLLEAMRRGDQHGVWGGLTATQRRRLAKKLIAEAQQSKPTPIKGAA